MFILFSFWLVDVVHVNWTIWIELYGNAINFQIAVPLYLK